MKKIFSMNRFEGWNLSLPLIQGGMGVGEFKRPGWRGCIGGRHGRDLHGTDRI